MPKVSVLMLTYNHGRFISGAIDSVLMQKTAFDYEIVIGEDCSRDSTRQIVINYALRYPDKIRLLLAETNLGMIPNLVQTLRECKGQYVALLEGDDYWMSTDKLQKQADFLDANQDCATCFTSARVVSQNNSFQSYIIPPSEYDKGKYELEDLLKCNFIPTCSVMFRNGLIQEFPEWFYRQSMGDWPLHVLNAQYGAIGYIRDVAAVYRIHPAGNFSGRSPNQNLKDVISTYKEFDAFFHRKYSKLIDDAIIHSRLFGMKRCFLTRDYPGFFKSSIDLLRHHNVRAVKFVLNRLFIH
jgi:glycosyltransferase involved in cell wall biosynthesis